MRCRLRRVSGATYCCTNSGCGRIVKIESRKPRKVRLTCPGTAPAKKAAPEVLARARAIACAVVNRGGPQHGPGTELRKMLDEEGFNQHGCDCAATQAKMNRLGPDGCREHVEELVFDVLENAKKLGLPEQLRVPEAVRPLIEKAIRRAEAA